MKVLLYQVILPMLIKTLLQALFNTMDIGFIRVGGVMANNSGVSSGFDDNVSYRGDIKSGIQSTSDRDLESDVDADNITVRVKMLIKH